MDEEEEEAGKGALKENVDDAGSLFTGCWCSAGGVGRLAILRSENSEIWVLRFGPKEPV